MKLSRSLRTTAFRFSLVYAVVFGIFGSIAFGFVYWSTENYVNRQVDARLLLESDFLVNLYHTRALPALLDTVRKRSQVEQRSYHFYLMISPEQREREPHMQKWWNDLRGEQRAMTLKVGQLFHGPADQVRSETPVRVVATPLRGGYLMLVGHDMDDELSLLAHIFNVVLLAVVFIILLALGGGVLMGRGVLRRIDTVSRTAGEIMAGDLTRRIPTGPRGDEFDELASKLNRMLERIEQLMTGMRQVTDNIAHDLRSPLTRMRNRLEVARMELREPAEYEQTIEQTIADADALIKTFNDLLSIAQAEADVRRADWQTVDLSAIVADLGELYEAVAEEQGVTMQCQVTPGLTVHGNRHLLAQAISNLLENAFKYGAAGQHVELGLSRNAQQAVLEVADHGRGIPASERQRVLGRFVRLDTARSSPGNGLGLSLVNAVALQHRAELSLADNQPGLRVALRFPLATTA